MRENAGSCRSQRHLWRYKNDPASDMKRAKHLAVFFTGRDREDSLFDLDVFCRLNPDLDEEWYAAHLLYLLEEFYCQDFRGIRALPCRVEVDMRYLDAEVFGYDIDSPTKRSIYRIGSVEEGVFRLQAGWARVYRPDNRIPVPPRRGTIAGKIRRAGFLPRHLAKGDEKACFAVRSFGEHVVVFTYGAALEEGYLDRIRGALLAAGVNSEIGLSQHCKLDKAAGAPDEAMLVIGIQ